MEEQYFSASCITVSADEGAGAPVSKTTANAATVVLRIISSVFRPSDSGRRPRCKAVVYDKGLRFAILTPVHERLSPNEIEAELFAVVGRESHMRNEIPGAIKSLRRYGDVG